MDQPKKLKVVCLSDTHNQAADIIIPNGDILIHAGDFTDTGHPQEVAVFNDFLRQSKFEVKIVIAGNHDLTFDIDTYKNSARRYHKEETDLIDPKKTKELLTDCIYLENSSCDLKGYKVYGSPYVAPSENYKGFNFTSEEHVQTIRDLIPTDTEILITHGPPHMINDLDELGDNKGCPVLRKTVLERVKPLYHIYGHVHEAYG